MRQKRWSLPTSSHSSPQTVTPPTLLTLEEFKTSERACPCEVISA